MLPLYLLGFLIALGIFLFTRRGKNLSHNEQVILDTLTEGGVSKRAAMYWLAVSMYETGDFTSRLFKLANNAFGMGVAKDRSTNRSGTIWNTDGGNMREFSAYSSLKDSVRDLLLYMDYSNYPADFVSPDALVAFMKQKGYFEQALPLYLAGVKSKLDKIL